MRVLISDRVDPGCVDVLQSGGRIEADLSTGLSPADLLERIDAYDGLIVRSATRVTGEVIRRARRMRAIGRAGAGVDNIDVDEATRRGIVVMNTPGGNSVSTAEHTVAMVLSLARNVPQGTASMKAGRWEPGTLTGVELAGKTIGVFGLGQVGREVTQRAAALGLRVLAYDPPVTEEVAQSYGAQLAPEEQIWEEADFLTFHVPLTAQTRHRLSEGELARCRDGVRVINCARGGIVDEQALLQALDSGKVAGAALDVYESEPPEAGSRLVAHERVICTPHLAAATREAQSSVALQVAAQVRDVLTGGAIHNAVNVPSLDPEAYEKLRPHLELGERLGRIHGQLAKEDRLRRITVEYHGEIATGSTSSLTSAVVLGLMESFAEEGTLNLVNARMVAQERGVRIDELTSSEAEDYASLLTVALEFEGGGRRVLSGTLFGHQDPRIVRVDEYDLDAVPEGHMLFYVNDDVPGIIGRIGSTMGRRQINIARMACGRHHVGGRALTVLNVDSPVPETVIEEILTDPHITWARLVSL